MDPQDFKDLLNRYAADKCSPEEQREVERLMLKYPLSKNWKWKSELHKNLIKDNMRKQIFNQVDRDLGKHRKRKAYWMTAVASLLLLIGISTFFYLQLHKTINGEQVIAEAINEIYNDVTLTDATGRVTVLKNKEQILDLRKLIAKDAKWNSSGSLNTLRVPSQHQFNLVLMDGTKVRLNAGSSLSFPTQFTAVDRTVKLEGEAYFEVVPNHSKPFMVNAKKSQIKVTGTKFNVAAYPADPRIITSLIEGGVAFHMNKKQYPLKPGYEIIADGNKNSVEVKSFEKDQVMAWIDGYFIFNNMDLVSVMKHVARWYNISVIAPAVAPTKRIGGTFPNTASLDDLLKDLELLSGVKFIRKGKEVQVVY
ncbi:FecR family protein [Sphingobacterium sp. UDSM-2020]|uniref:FecR family protein n=1 Tax=Sphingobacterium sp. UDSM-2020 TaxID=2795738 RepID=UPI001938B60C|nr:FecR domain-containing protein [Sphingobacterium sp. UDSM-2020]QQD15609.1 FecR domain-containing protein [Sphingobacterium sp. UDSM-2020]